MRWRTIITPNELTEMYPFFSKLHTKLHASAVSWILNKVSRYLERPIGIELPADTKPFHADPESLRALRLLEKLRDADFLRSFYFNKHTYGDEPRGYVAIAELKNVDRFGFSGKGTDMFSQSKTLWPTLGEAIERYAIMFFKPSSDDQCDASFSSLSGRKADIFSLAGFDEILRKTPHSEYELSYTNETIFRWTHAVNLHTENTEWVPLQWFSFTHMRTHVHPEPLLVPPITTGIATGQNTTDATLRSLLEVIERDAFIIYWLNQIPPAKINPATSNDPQIRELARIAERYRLEFHVLYLRTDVPAHTVCTFLIDRSGIGPALIVGAKTSLDITDAVYSTMSDTLSQRGVFRKMMDARENRERDLTNISQIGHKERMLFWFEVQKLTYLTQFLSGEFLEITSLPSYTSSSEPENNLRELIRFFDKKNYPIYAKELLNEHLRELTEGLSVIGVKIPQMQPLSLEESIPTLGGNRLYDVPEYLGFRRPRNRYDFFTSVPHPFP